MRHSRTAYRSLGLALLLSATAAHGPALGDSAGAATHGDALRGGQLYESRCVACHSLDSHRVGPLHRGVFGRRVGSVDDYAYSPALAGAELTWTTETLDRWLTNPQALIPGQRMNFRVKDAQDRADIIAYLRQQSMEGSN